jgi:hypothetical protein
MAAHLSRRDVGRLKPFAIICVLTALAVSCAPKDKGPQRIHENGVEVVVNGAAPYAVPGQPHSLSLHEEFRIDLEDAALADAGLADASTLDVDSKGRIYLFRPVGPGTRGRVIYQFDDQGKLLQSFGTIGQGPGELMYPRFLRITAADEIPVYSQGAGSVVFLDAAGRLLRSMPMPTDDHFLPHHFVLLPNGNYLGQYLPADEQSRFSKITLAIFDAHLKKIRDIHDFKLPEPESFENLLASLPLTAVTDHGFFVNSGPSGSDIVAYDLDGRLIRLIRAPFRAFRISSDYKKKLLDRIPKTKGYELVRTLIRSVEMYPLFQALFSDDRGRLFAAGYEKDPKTGANMCDVFSPDGVRILRTALGYQDLLLLLSAQQAFDVVIKKDRCYCLREKADGFKEVVVYSMFWR